MAVIVGRFVEGLGSRLIIHPFALSARWPFDVAQGKLAGGCGND